MVLVARVTETRSEEHTSELQSQSNLVCRLLLEKNGQLGDHDRVAVEVGRDGAREREHVARARRAVLARGRADRDELEEPVSHVFFLIRGAPDEPSLFPPPDALLN